MVSRVQIGPNVVTTDFSANRSLKRDDPFGWNTPAMQPHRNMGLPNWPVRGTPSQLCQSSSHNGLTADLFDRLAQGSDAHDLNYNTVSVIDVNARSVIRSGQTKRMPKKGRETPFWKRLKLARTTCKPSKSMRQEDIRKDYGAAHQSTVTKWKTGGEKGTTLPGPETILMMALDTDVSADWLWSGRGEMRRRNLDAVTVKILDALEQLEPLEKEDILKEAISKPVFRDINAAKQREQHITQLRHRDRR